MKKTLILGLFLSAIFLFYGCQTVENTEKKMQKDFELNSSPASPQSTEQQIEQHGEP